MYRIIDHVVTGTRASAFCHELIAQAHAHFHVCVNSMATKMLIGFLVVEGNCPRRYGPCDVGVFRDVGKVDTVLA